MSAESDDIKYPYSWEGAISLLRKDPDHQQLIYDAYLTDDLVSNCERFSESTEFAEVLRLIAGYHSKAKNVLDIPGGNGIAAHAFASAGFTVTTVEPDVSSSVGRGAIASVMASKGLSVSIIEAYGEDLPFETEQFDIVYVRQGLHHAQNLGAMLKEYFRVLLNGGLLIACREHVVDDYGKSLQDFLDAQVDHQLYGGEHAFLLKDYRSEITAAGFEMLEEIEPYNSPINLHPNSLDDLKKKILDSRGGKILGIVLPDSMVEKIGMWRLKNIKLPGRLYSFVAIKPASGQRDAKHA